MRAPTGAAGAQARRAFLGHVAGTAALGLACPAMAASAGAAALNPDADLIQACRTFDALEARIGNYFSDGVTPIADEDERDRAMAPLHAQQQQLLDVICATQATTPEGIIARASTIVGWDPDLASDAVAGDPWDRRLVAALLRDLVGGGKA